MALKALITVDELYLVEVDIDPTQGAGVSAPLSSIAILNNGGSSSGMWVKTGAADTAWSPVTMSIANTVKGGVVTSGSFSGNPKKATVTFSSAFADATYTIGITGADARTWSYESKTASGFTINSNANAALTGEVSWQATASGS
jgi:hypothetical protein